MCHLSSNFPICESVPGMTDSTHRGNQLAHDLLQTLAEDDDPAARLAHLIANAPSPDVLARGLLALTMLTYQLAVDVRGGDHAEGRGLLRQFLEN